MKKYTIIKPDLELKNNLMIFGFMCGKGWHPLIEKSLDAIQEIVDRKGLDIQVTEIKEKWGGLRIYLDSYTDEIFEITQIAEKQSYNICELCGKPGKLHNESGWYVTRCDNCLEKENSE